MPVTPSGILAAFLFLETAGKSKPRGWTDQLLPAVIATWVAELPDIDDAELLAAAREYGRTGTGFWPALSDILDRVPRYGDPTAGPGCWTAFLTAASERGYSAGAPWDVSSTVENNDAAEDALRAIGGWGALCHASERDRPHLRREFLAAYRQTIVSRREAVARPLLSSTPTPQIEDHRK